MFVCSRCGSCCTSLANFGGLYNDLDDGTGYCKYYDVHLQSCKIYDRRPIKCNIEKSYSMFSSMFTYEQYIEITYKGCSFLRAMKQISRLHLLKHIYQGVCMFTQHFDSEQQGVFLDLLLKVINADGLIASGEQEKLDLYKSLFPDVSPKELPQQELASVFQTRKSKASIMLELLSVAMVDGSIHNSEHTLLNGIASALSISEQEMAEMTSWVSRMMELIRESQTFMEN